MVCFDSGWLPRTVVYPVARLPERSQKHPMVQNLERKAVEQEGPTSQQSGYQRNTEERTESPR